MLVSSTESLTETIINALERSAIEQSAHHRAPKGQSAHTVDNTQCWLVTVVNTYGSSPRPAGSMMFWSRYSGVVGSVSGGCIEEDILQKIREGAIDCKSTTLLSYGGPNTSQARFKLPCGGELSVIIEPLKNSDAERVKWQALHQSLKQRQGIARILNRLTGEWHWQLSRAFMFKSTKDTLHVYVGPVRKLLIVGANLTAIYLAQFASALDFNVTVCDPSDDASHYWQSVQHCQYIKAYPDGFVARDFGDSASAVVAVSHDPRIDDMALLEALPTQAFYVGAMGAKRTSQKRCERLKLLGLSNTDIQALHAPIGLDIGSKTPSEIAMSIAAHLVQQYNKVVAQQELSASCVL
ncbi:XdhC family protein [Marinagarivorans algicola]|uniref:XdhC family protein n=1 Tax=Marinagarivorans algicola TaxID=1513270 RepID=UPI0006B56616|nr:XdhC/CoxI family protein [Marinagarivorans algicola]